MRTTSCPCPFQRHMMPESQTYMCFFLLIFFYCYHNHHAPTHWNNTFSLGLGFGILITQVLQHWVSNLQTRSLPPTGLGGGLATGSSHSYPTTIANTKVTTTSTSSAGSQHLGWSSQDGLGYHTFNIEDSDGLYHNVLKGLPKLSQRVLSMSKPFCQRVQQVVHASSFTRTLLRYIQVVDSLKFHSLQIKPWKIYLSLVWVSHCTHLNLKLTKTTNAAFSWDNANIDVEMHPHGFNIDDNNNIDNGLNNYEDLQLGQMKTEASLAVCSTTHAVRGEASREATNKNLPMGA